MSGKFEIIETVMCACMAAIACVSDTACLACYIANGHIMTFSLPSLRPMLDSDYLPLTDLRYDGALSPSRTLGLCTKADTIGCRMMGNLDTIS